jgi:hypothetical protein
MERNMADLANKTQQAILDMLTENTGRHMLDSGSIYGYNYDSNKAINQKPRAWIAYGSPVMNVYYHLYSSLWLDEDTQASFDEYVKEHDPDNDTSWEDLLNAWCQYHGHEAKSGDITYNYENLLSTGYMWFDIELNNGNDIVCVRTHNGCDIRGGYSSPRFFEPRHFDFANFLTINVVSLYCEESDCDFSVTNDYGDGKWRDFEDKQYDIAEDENGNLLCPLCGNILFADLTI